MAAFRVLIGVALLMCLLGLATSATTGGVVSDSSGTLSFAHVLYRHGDRAPAAFYPTDPYANSDSWPIGLGELSNTGKQQHYKLGQWFRDRYDTTFLPAAYSEQKISIRSTDVDRTIASALSNLAGLFPPTGNQVWNSTIAWQPIPVHNVPAADDWLLGGSVPPCPAYEKEFAAVLQLPDVQDVITEYQTQINYVLQSAGENTTIGTSELLTDVLLIRDTLYIETLYNKTLPAWTQSIYPSTWLDEVALLYYVLPAYTDTLAKFRVGYFLKDVLDRSASKVAGTLSPNISLQVYSAHDINISTVLQGLGLWDDHFVSYAATLLFEVSIHQKVGYLEIYYKRTPDTVTPELLFIPNCGYTCSLANMYSVYASILPKNDFATECNL